MNYYFSKTLMNCTFEEAIERTTVALKTEGFGVLTDIDMKTTLKNKLDVDIPKYEILGACNPAFAYKALQSEPNIGLLLPCNVIVSEVEGGINVAAINPIVAMESVENEDLGPIAEEVANKLKSVIEIL